MARNDSTCLTTCEQHCFVLVWLTVWKVHRAAHLLLLYLVLKETASTEFPSDSGASQHGGRMKTEITGCSYRVPGPAGALFSTSNLSTYAHPKPGKKSVPGGVDHQTLPYLGRHSPGSGLVHSWTSRLSLGDISALHEHYQHVHPIHGILIFEKGRVNSACGFCRVFTKGCAGNAKQR